MEGRRNLPSTPPLPALFGELFGCRRVTWKSMRVILLLCMCSCACVCQVAEQLMTIAYESGVNLFDTAEVYSGGK